MSSSNANAAILQRAYTICFQSAYAAEFDAIATCTNFSELCVFLNAGLAEDIDTCRSTVRVSLRYPILKKDPKRNGTPVRTTCYSLCTVGDLLVGGCVGSLLIWKWRDLIEERYNASQIDLETDPICTFDVPEVSSICCLPEYSSNRGESSLRSGNGQFETTEASDATIACATGDGQIRLVDLGSLCERARCAGHTDTVHSVSARGATNPSEFVSASEDGSVRVWDARSSRCVVQADFRKLLATEKGNGSANGNDWSKRSPPACRFALATSSEWLVTGGTFEPVLFHTGTRSVLKRYPIVPLALQEVNSASKLKSATLLGGINGCDTEFLSGALSTSGDRVLFGTADGRVLHFDTFESKPLAAFTMRSSIAHIYHINVISTASLSNREVPSDSAMDIDSKDIYRCPIDSSRRSDSHRTVICGAGPQLSVCDELGCTLKRLLL